MAFRGSDKAPRRGKRQVALVGALNRFAAIQLMFSFSLWSTAVADSTTDTMLRNGTLPVPSLTDRQVKDILARENSSADGAGAAQRGNKASQELADLKSGSRELSKPTGVIKPPTHNSPDRNNEPQAVSIR